MFLLIPWWIWVTAAGTSVAALGVYEATKPAESQGGMPYTPPVTSGNAGVSASVDWKGILALAAGSVAVAYAVKKAK